MGREIRIVPPNWEHPKEKNQFNGEIQYIPMFDEPYLSSLHEWISNNALWEQGKHPDQISHKDDPDPLPKNYAEWGGSPPDHKGYRPDWKEGEATWFQVYETVSEGTPVTPPFTTKEELIEYLVANGDFWDQQRRSEPRNALFQMPCDPWKREAAERFVNGPGWAPSFVVSNGHFQSGVEAMAEMEPKKP